jgi:hypothetical protein
MISSSVIKSSPFYLKKLGRFSGFSKKSADTVCDHHIRRLKLFDTVALFHRVYPSVGCAAQFEDRDLDLDDLHKDLYKGYHACHLPDPILHSTKKKIKCFSLSFRLRGTGQTELSPSAAVHNNIVAPIYNSVKKLARNPRHGYTETERQGC